MIVHESTDKATIHGDNRGATSTEPGPQPGPTRGTDDSITTKGTDNDVFTNLGDRLDPTESKGIVRITESLNNVTISSSSISAEGLQADILGSE